MWESISTTHYASTGCMTGYLTDTMTMNADNNANYVESLEKSIDSDLYGNAIARYYCIRVNDKNRPSETYIRHNNEIVRRKNGKSI